ncbi:MAG: ARMT1-like domain-containing protein, partial [Halobacteriota archaeon]|nr:ARMT1-like domain-containing protein [Halobacteriota archaeon]
MKVRPECVSCLFERAVFECDLVLEDEPEKKIEALKELLEYAAENFSVDTVPALIGTVREEIIKKYSGSNDPYEEFKHESNETAKRLLPMAREFYESAEDKLEALVRIIAAANSMEYGVRGHSYDHATFHRVFEETIKERLVWDKENIRSSMESHDKILYLLDNCGEVIFDIFAIKRLFEMGKEVVVAPKTGPIINDATVKDLKEAGYEHKIVPSGSYIGISLEEC